MIVTGFHRVHGSLLCDDGDFGIFLFGNGAQLCSSDAAGRNRRGSGTIFRVMALAPVLLSCATAVVAVVVPYISSVLASGFSHTKILLTRNLFFVLLPLIAVKGMAIIYGSILHAHRRSAPVASAPITSVVLILLWAKGSTRIYAVAVGTVVGMLVELVIVAWGVRRQEVDRVPHLFIRHAASGQVMSQYLPMLSRALVLGGTTVADQSMAASLADGIVASLNYGSRLVAVVIYVLAGGLGTAVLPFFSSYWPEALIDERRLRTDGCLHPGPSGVRWGVHISGRRNWHRCLWTVLIFQAWLDENRQPPTIA